MAASSTPQHPLPTQLLVLMRLVVLLQHHILVLAHLLHMVQGITLLLQQLLERTPHSKQTVKQQHMMQELNQVRVVLTVCGACDAVYISHSCFVAGL